jgi:asparagine synthetase B (glutamine-hydrolysing)
VSKGCAVRPFFGTHLCVEVRDAVILGVRERPMGDVERASWARRVERSWDRHGERFPEHVPGIWAWVVDRPDRLIAYRDRLGVLPMAYARASGGGWWLSSDLDALTQGPRTPNCARVLQLLTGAGDPRDPSDFVEGISRVAPGHRVTLREREAPTTAPWWCPPTELDPEVTVARARDELDGALREVLGELPRGGIAATLSGGLDSSTVAHYLRETRPGLPTASMVFPTLPVCDESEEIARFERALDLRGHHVDVTPMWTLRHPELHARALNAGPQLAPDEVYLSYFYEEARRRTGASGLITGQEADGLLQSLFTLFFRRMMAPRFRGRQRAWMWRAEPTYLLRQGAWWLGSRALGVEGVRRVRRWVEAARGRRRPSWLHPEVSVAGAAGWEAEDAGRWVDAPGELGRIKWRSTQTWRWELFRRASMRNQRRAGVWSTSPFLDGRLWEPALRWGPEVFTGVARGGRELKDKWVLRTLMQRQAAYPNDLAMRSKWTSFDAHVERGLLVERRGWVEEQLEEMRLEALGIVDARAVRALYRALCDRVDASSGEGVAFALEFWVILSAELWARSLESQ